jgi:putative SOS response-associated peptidase YedK
MCGRATYKLTWEEIVALYRLTLNQPPVNTRARYNVCPTTTIDTIVESEGKRALVPMRWGLVPSWWSKPLKELKLATFNSRAETVTTKPLIAEKDFASWLDGSAGPEMLKPAASDLLQRWPVSKRVNSSRAPDEDASLIEKVELTSRSP